jgi:hypothetical protein
MCHQKPNPSCETVPLSLQVLKHVTLLIYFQSKMETLQIFITTEEDNGNNLLPEETPSIEPVKSER